MPVIINGSTGVSGTDGSAGTPAVQGTDTNTGMYFPAADQIAFAEGGVEAMRLDASGNVGIGTTTPGARLHIFNASGNTQARVYTPNGTSASLEFSSDTYSFINAAGGGSLGIQVGGTERARITSGGDFQFNSGYGSVATAYGCRAWVNFNGTGTVAIRGSGNVSSITDNGVGDYTVNFATAMPDTNYAAVIGGGDLNTAFVAGTNRLSFPPATTAFRYFTLSNGGPQNDTVNTSVAIFR